MNQQIDVGGISVDVIFKDIQNIHLGVHPPTGRIRISAPERMSLENIRVYAISKLNWIQKHQRNFQQQERETSREYLDLESHYVWGQRHLLILEEKEKAPSVELRHKHLVLTVRPGSSLAKKEAVISAWYRDEVRKKAEPLIAKWEPVLGARVNNYFIQRMRTKWGSCNPQKNNIRLNSQLGKKPRKCLEYIIVHEMAHLVEPSHSPKFIVLMDSVMPQWRSYSDILNSFPLAHEEWAY